MRILLVGFGAVGQSLADVLSSEAGKLTHEFGLRPKIVGIVDSRGAAISLEGIDLRKALESKKRSKSLKALGPEMYKDGKTAVDAIKEVDCEVVVETTPTDLIKGEPGLTHIRTAMKEGRHVICTNKGPLALAMPALVELANHNHVMFKFSGTVGGGTPVLDFAKKCLEGSRITSIRGILNGTSNYILSRMSAEGAEMSAALAEAQKLGYAEADPTYDIGGFDTACKLVITSNYVLGTSLSLNDVDITGITGISGMEVSAAKADGKTVKLIGSVGKTAKVAPEMIPVTHPLNVSGTYNAICFDTHPAGEITLVGKGAGGPETASAVIRDLIEIRKAFSR
jgi:homoserine dehydrogenase